MKPLLFLFTLIISIPLWGQNGATRQIATFRPVENTTFQPGEYLLFRVHYGFVTAGYASMEVKPGTRMMHGRRCYQVVGKGWTSAGFDPFYRCRDRYETFIDHGSLLPVQFNRQIREGSFSHDSDIRFDQENRRAYYTGSSRQPEMFQVPAGIHDVISAFYYARSRYEHTQLEVGDRLSLRNFIDRKTYGLEAVVVERETIRVEGTRYRALHMQLLVEEAGLITDGSTIHFWISDDENKIPLRIESELTVGSLKADLIEAKNLLNPFSAQLN